MKMNVTTLPQQRVRYGYHTPSMSRKGGIRLHPIKDGTAPMGEQLTMLRRRDKAGNKLRDVVDPKSGFCVGVTSPLEGRVSNKGTSGGHTVETRRAEVEKHKADVDGVRHTLYVDEDGFVIRTTDMGDSRRPVAYVNNQAQPAKEARVAQTTRRNATKATAVPGGTGAGGRITREDCVAYIQAMAKGRKVVITPFLISQAREVLKKKQAAAAKLFAQRDKKASRG